VIGPISSSEAEVVFAQAGRLHVPTLTGTANKEGITDLGQGWAFRDTATNTQLYSTVLPIYQQRFGVTKVAMIYDEKQAFAVAAAQGALPAVAQQAGISIAKTFTIDTGQTDFASVVSELKGEDLNGLFVITAPVEGGLIAKELERQGVSLPVLGHPAQNSGAFRDAGGSSIVDWVVPSVTDPSSTSPKAQAFQAQMAKLDKDPPTVPEAANYYDIVYMLRQAMTDQKVDAGTATDTARSDIRDGLKGLKGFVGVAGPVAFQPNGDVDRHVFAVLISNGQTQVIS
jgi:branched-chain amino acid transport system substrate-binding protein